MFRVTLYDMVTLKDTFLYLTDETELANFLLNYDKEKCDFLGVESVEIEEVTMTMAPFIKKDSGLEYGNKKEKE